jgi:hypothetical protein
MPAATRFFLSALSQKSPSYEREEQELNGGQKYREARSEAKKVRFFTSVEKFEFRITCSTSPSFHMTAQRVKLN